MVDVCRFVLLRKAASPVAEGGDTRSRNTARAKPARSHTRTFEHGRDRARAPDRYVIIFKFVLYPEHYINYNIAAARFLPTYIF